MSGCTKCEPKGHIPPPNKDCLNPIYPDEPAEAEVECLTEEMKCAVRNRAIEIILTVALIVSLLQPFARDSLHPPPGPALWYWVSLIVLSVWGAASAGIAFKTVYRTPEVKRMMRTPLFMVIGLSAWIAGVFTSGSARTIAAVVAFLALAWEFRVSFIRTKEKPSIQTYVAYLGFKAYIAGLSAFVLALCIDSQQGRTALLVYLIIPAWLALESASHFFTLPIVVGFIAWELETSSGLELIIVSIVFSVLFFYGLHARVLSQNIMNGRNRFTYALRYE